MSNDTYITFTGWVGTAPELRELPGGQQVASFRVASTPRRIRDGQWEDGPTTWHQVKAWRRLAGHVAGSLKTGDPVVVHGRLVADVWNKPDGSVSTQLVVVASSVGHDLNHGTSAFAKAARPGQVGQGMGDPFAVPVATEAAQLAVPATEPGVQPEPDAVPGEAA